MTQTIYLFRHGVTDWNVQLRLQGHSDIPLNSEGELQAKQLKTFFDQKNIDLLYSSDLIRARQTAGFALPKKQIDQTSEQLREVQLGVVEGRHNDEVIAEYGLDFWLRWQNMVPPDWTLKFPEGETKQEVVTRTNGFLLEKLNENPAAKHIAVAAHGMLIRCFVHHLEPNRRTKVETPNCCVYKIDFNSAEKIFSNPHLVFQVEQNT